MSSTAYCVPLEREVDTANLSDEEYRVLVISHRNPEYNKDNAAFRCLARQGNNSPMHPVWRNSRFYLAHYPGDNTENHDHDPTPMSVEHKNQTEYIWRAAQSAGLETSDLKKGLPTGNNTVLDLAVWGKHNTGFEVQWSALSSNKAQLRAARSFDAGWPTAWITTTNPAWTEFVPSVRISDIDWGDELPAEGTVAATITEFYTTVSWPHRTTLENKSRVLLLDDFVTGVVAGDIIAVTGPDGPTFTDAAALGMLIEFGHKAWTPAYTPKKRNANRTRPCNHSEKPPEPPPSVKPVVVQPISRPDPRPSPIVAPVVIKRDPCQKCGGKNQQHIAETLKYSGAQGIWMCPACYSTPTPVAKPEYRWRCSECGSRVIHAAVTTCWTCQQKELRRA